MRRLIDLDETMKNLAKANMSRTGNEFERFLLSQSTVEAIPKDQYETRLKADMVAMLTDIQLEIEELKSYESADGQDLVMLADIGILFQQKIDALKAESEDNK